MGGSAFTSGEDPLCTPRMPKTIYLLMKERTHKALNVLYQQVATPLEGPAKKDYGDVDILVFEPKFRSADKNEALEDIREVLGATRIIVDKGKDVSAHFAVPWPSRDSIRGFEFRTQVSIEESRETEKVTEDGRVKHVQVDVKVCENIEKFEWMKFRNAHGDMWNLLGATIRPYGLTVDEEGFWIRVPEIESENRTRSKVWLTNRPYDVLWFLGLHMGLKWEEGFKSNEDMFEYVSQCRCFWIRPLDPDDSDVSALAEDLRRLRANDRRRLDHRPVFKEWVEVWKPQCRAEGRFATPPMGREALTKEAIVRFGIQEKYFARRDEFLQEKQRNQILKDIIKGHTPPADPGIPREVTYRACLIKALKAIIFDGDKSYGVFPKTSLKDDEGFLIQDDIVDFMCRHMDDLGKIAQRMSDDAWARKKQKQALKAAEATAAAAEAREAAEEARNAAERACKAADEASAAATASAAAVAADASAGASAGTATESVEPPRRGNQCVCS